MTYNPIEYWKEAGKHYFQDFIYSDNFFQQEKELVKYLKTLEFRTVLELGCGFGRITRLMFQYFTMEIDDYVAVDVSPDQIRYAKNYPFPNTLRFIQSDIESLLISKKFDLVLAVEVLMHQTKDKIQFIIDKMKNLSNKHVINIDYTGPPVEGLSPHNFVHPYYLIYQDPLKTVNIGKQTLFHYQK